MGNGELILDSHSSQDGSEDTEYEVKGKSS